MQSFVNMIKRLTLSAFVIILPAVSCMASTSAEGVSLEDCIEWSLSRNVSLQSLKLEKSLDTPAALSAWGRFLPSVSVSYGINQSRYYNPTFVNSDGTVSTYPRLETFIINGTEIDTLLPVPEGKRRSSGLALRVDEILFDGGRNYFNLKNTRIGKDIRDSQIETQMVSLRVSVIKAYALAVAAEKNLDLAFKVVEQRRLQQRLANVRFETGSVTRRDVMLAEVDLGNALNDSLQALLDVRDALENLNLIIGLPLDSTYKLAGLPPLFDPVWDADSLAEIALENRSDLRTNELTRDIRKNEVKSAKGDYLPSLTASYLHSRSEQSGANVDFTLKPRNRYSEVGLTLSWQIFDRFTRYLQLQQAKVNLKQSEFTSQELNQSIAKQVRSTVDHLTVLFHQAKVAVQNKNWAEETLKFEQERYRLGSATAIELGSAQVGYMQAYSRLIKIETEFFMALGNLEQAVGINLNYRE